MHDKRRRPEATRASCLLCKPDKISGWSTRELGRAGFDKLRRERLAAVDLATVRLTTGEER